MANKRADHSNKDRAYLEGVRPDSQSRWIHPTLAFENKKIDLDVLCYCRFCGLILWLTEDHHREGPKTTTVTVQAGKQMRVPAYEVAWTASESPNPTSPKYPDIAEVRRRELWPQRSPWTNQTLRNDAIWEVARRLEHYAQCERITSEQYRDRVMWFDESNI